MSICFEFSFARLMRLLTQAKFRSHYFTTMGVLGLVEYFLLKFNTIFLIICFSFVCLSLIFIFRERVFGGFSLPSTPITSFEVPQEIFPSGKSETSNLHPYFLHVTYLHILDHSGRALIR